MAPMIDMVFLLLVFFMCVSTMTQSAKQIEVELPESESSKVGEDLSNRTVINIDATGNIFFENRQVSREILKSEIERVQSSAVGTLRWQIRADRDTPFRLLKQVMKTCAEAGAYDLIYSTFQSK